MSADDHGTDSTYVNHGCRCDLCRQAHSEYNRVFRYRRYERTAANGGVAPISSHGANTYRQWGCRCRTCTDGNTRQGQRDRARVGAVTA